jgi:hypothetical protein
MQRFCALKNNSLPTSICPWTYVDAGGASHEFEA